MPNSSDLSAKADRSVSIDGITIQAHEPVAEPTPPSAGIPSPLPSRRTALWVLFLCTLVYFTCQLQRWSIGVVAKNLEVHLSFGDGSGGGLAYQIIAGPTFNLLFTTCGIVLAIVGREWNRTRLLAANLALGAVSTTCMGLAESYAQLALARALQGLSQAGSNSFCAALISATFPPALLSRAFGVFNFGLYGGYGLAFSLGNVLVGLNTPSQETGYKLMFWIFAIPSVLGAFLMAFTARDATWEQRRALKRAAEAESRGQQNPEQSLQRIPSSMRSPLLSTTHEFASPSPPPQLKSPTAYSSLADTASSSPADSPGPSPSASPDLPASEASFGASVRLLLTSPPLLVLCLASSFRNGAGVIWGYNTQQYFESIDGGSLSAHEISVWMSFIPIVFGSAGAICGGIASDHLLRKYGPKHQVALLVVAQILAAPCAAGVLLLPAPYCFLIMFPMLLIGESYIGTCMAMLTELTPNRLHPFVLSLYIFCLANLGGNMNLLLPPVKDSLLNHTAHPFRNALLILWPGFMIVSACCYAILWIWTGRGQTTFKRKRALSVVHNPDAAQ